MNENGLIACFGTWQDLRVERDKITHVQRFYDAWQGPAFDINGIGTRHGRVSRYLGGAIGFGWRFRVRKARRIISQNPAVVTWSIVGHSRGGMIALHLADMLMRDNIKVRNLILLDPVGSFGINAFIKIWITRYVRRALKVEYEQLVPANVENTLAIYAYDEERPHFSPTYISRTTNEQNCTRCWFEGEHRDIGGYGERHIGDYVGGWIRLLCSEDFSGSIVWPPEWQHQHSREYTLERGSESKRLMPVKDFLVVVNPNSKMVGGFRITENMDKSMSESERLIIKHCLNESTIID